MLCRSWAAPQRSSVEAANGSSKLHPVDSIRLSVNEQYSVAVECVLVLQQLTSRGGVLQTGNELTGLYFCDIATAPTNDDEVHAKPRTELHPVASVAVIVLHLCPLDNEPFSFQQTTRSRLALDCAP